MVKQIVNSENLVMGVFGYDGVLEINGVSLDEDSISDTIKEFPVLKKIAPQEKGKEQERDDLIAEFMFKNELWRFGN